MTCDPINIDLIHTAGDWPASAEMEVLVQQAITATVNAARLRYPPGAELSIILSDDDHLRSLNKQWRNLDKPTNVLSFPGENIEPGGMPGVLLGDIVIASETVGREALRDNKPITDHFTHLVVHGFLHLFGYDHINDMDAEIMETLEQRSLSALGLPDPYLETIEDDEL